MRKNNIICIGFNSYFWSDYFVNYIKKKKINEIIWFGESNPRIKKIKFINFTDAEVGKLNQDLNNQNKKININPQKIINENFEILNSLFSRYETFNVKKSKEFKFNFYKLLINNLVSILNNEIKTIFFNSSPHHCWSYLLYVISKKLNKNIVIFHKTNLDGYVHLSNSIDYNFNTKNKRLKFDNLTLRRYYKKKINNFVKRVKFEYKNNIPIYLLNHKKKNSITLIYIFKRFLLLSYKYLFLKNLKSFEIFFKNSNQMTFSEFEREKIIFKSIFSKKKTMSYYNDLCNNSFNINKDKFIYFSASYQPERTSCPEVHNYYDQYKLVKMLSENSKDFLIYYKEHPSMFLGGRCDHGIKNIKYYNKLKKLKNLRFVPTNFDTYKLIDKSIFVCSCNGTVNFESLLRGKLSILFAKNWMNFFSGIEFIYNKYGYKKFLNSLNKFKIKKNYNKRKLDIFLSNCAIIPEVDQELDFLTLFSKKISKIKRFKLINSLISKT